MICTSNLLLISCKVIISSFFDIDVVYVCEFILQMKYENHNLQKLSLFHRDASNIFGTLHGNIAKLLAKKKHLV